MTRLNLIPLVSHQTFPMTDIDLLTSTIRQPAINELNSSFGLYRSST